MSAKQEAMSTKYRYVSMYFQEVDMCRRKYLEGFGFCRTQVSL